MKSGRREFVKQLGLISIGFSLTGTTCVTSSNEEVVNNELFVPDQDQVDTWLHVLEDGRIKILTGKMELGQGISTAIMQVAAEELDTRMDLVEINLAETNVTANEGYTAGSRSIESSAMSVRYAAATAREEIKKLASEKWNIQPTEIELKNGIIRAGDRSATIYELLDRKQINGRIDKTVEVKAKTVRQIVGHPIKRRDIENMVRGNQVYVQDLRFPDMVHARVVRPRTYTSKLSSIDTSEIENKEGFLKIVRQGSFIGVLAEKEYQAIEFSKQLSQLAKWDFEEALPADKPLKDYLRSRPVETDTEEESGNWESAVNHSPVQHKASYFKPYIMHAANGPSCAVAFYENDSLNVWSHTQGVYPLRKTLANLLKIPEDAIHIKGVPGSGCYGHNGADDVAAEAALLAMNYPGRHVRLQWMREDEHGWEPYGSAMIMELQAGLSSEGKIQGWKYNLWSDGHSTRPNGSPENLLPARFLDQGHGVPGAGFKGGAVRNSSPLYKIQNLKTQSHIFRGPLRKSALRGLGAYANIYAIESFMDELAHKAGIDPIEFRLMHLKDKRAITCLQTLKKNISGVDLKEREGLGVAFAQYKNSASYLAVAAHVHVDPGSGKPHVKKMWGVIDSGETINPDGLKNQTEGGMIQSASWTLMEEVKFDKNHITSLDWYSYPIFRFPDAPEVEVEVIDRVDQPPLGAGEAAQGPAAAAIVNAIFNATGVRVRDLPVNSAFLKRS
ncbi:MAG: molybdopterin cofactor-binding domain-containing protein [Candidatus Cyclobacteriaceae bacterium M2_1C_046]